MERLTEWNTEHTHGSLVKGDGYTRLAEYEDTGFSPEDIEDIKDCLDVEGDGKSGEDTLKDLLELMQYRKTGLTPQEINELKSYGECGDSIIGSCNMNGVIKQLQRECDYWESEAKKWCDQSFEYRLQLEGGK
jgi:hypothetical protein